MPNISPETDKLLHPYLLAKSEDIARDRLDELFSETLIPQIKEIIGKEFPTLAIEERKEIFAEAQVKIFRFLKKYRERIVEKVAEVRPLKNLKGFTVTLTRNAKKNFLLKKNDDYRRAMYRFLHLVEKLPENCCVFRDEKRKLFFSFRKHQNKKSEFDFEEIVKRIIAKNPKRLFLKTHQILPLVLQETACPVGLDELVKLELKITGATSAEDAPGDDILENLAQSLHDNPQVKKENLELLQKLWRETKALRSTHRKSLLLNMKDGVGFEAISLWFVLGIATEAEMIAALEVSANEFDALFSRLPLKSAEIADILGISDTETMTKADIVDNLRKAARDRLKRRIRPKDDAETR